MSQSGWWNLRGGLQAAGGNRLLRGQILPLRQVTTSDRMRSGVNLAMKRSATRPTADYLATEIVFGDQLSISLGNAVEESAKSIQLTN